MSILAICVSEQGCEINPRRAANLDMTFLSQLVGKDLKLRTTL